jgi:hypothetical protein
MTPQAKKFHYRGDNGLKRTVNGLYPATFDSQPFFNVKQKNKLENGLVFCLFNLRMKTHEQEIGDEGEQS